MPSLETSEIHKGQRVSCSLGTGVVIGIFNSIIHGGKAAWIQLDIPISDNGPLSTLVRLEDVEPISSISD